MTVIISDYDKGFLTAEDIEYIYTNHPQVFLDTKKILGNWANALGLLRSTIMNMKDLKLFPDTNVQR